MNFVSKKICFYHSMFVDFKELEGLAKWSFNNPYRLGYWIYNHHLYAPDKTIKDNFEDPYLVFKRRNRDGWIVCDCEEVVIIAYECIRLWNSGWNHKAVCVYRPDAGHAICSYEYRGKWSYIDVSGVKDTPAMTLEGLVKYVPGYENLTSWRKVNIKGNTILEEGDSKIL